MLDEIPQTNCLFSLSDNDCDSQNAWEKCLSGNVITNFKSAINVADDGGMVAIIDTVCVLC